MDKNNIVYVCVYVYNYIHIIYMIIYLHISCKSLYTNKMFILYIEPYDVLYYFNKII